VESTSENRPARKQQQRSLRTQQKLLDAAIEAFSECGFKGTSTRDIAERAGVHHPLITYHFKNKDRLWRSSVDRIWREFNASLGQALKEADQNDPKAQMAAAIRAYVRFGQQQPALHRMTVQESSVPNPRLDWLVETHLRPFFDRAVARIHGLQARGVAPPGNPALLFNMIRGAAGSLTALNLELKATSGVDLDSADTVDELADMIVRVFLPGDP
jgi:AcrR family transcriptional regulator